MASVVPGGTTVKLDRLNIRRVAALTSLSLVGGFCERVNISEVDFQWVPRRRRSIDVEVRALALLRMMRIYCPSAATRPACLSPPIRGSYAARTFADSLGGSGS